MLIEEGNIVAFEYAAEYLSKHDPIFIRSYIDRYSSGIFNELELNMIEGVEYRPDYISEVAIALK